MGRTGGGAGRTLRCRMEFSVYAQVGGTVGPPRPQVDEHHPKGANFCVLTLFR